MAMRVVTFIQLFALFGMGFLSVESYAVEKIIQMNCVYVAEKRSGDAFDFGRIYQTYYTFTEQQKQRRKKDIDDMLEIGDNKQYQIRKLLEKNGPKDDSYYTAYIEQEKFGWEYAKIIAQTNPGQNKLSYERMIYDACMEVAVETEKNYDNSPAQIERMKQIYRLQLESLRPAPSPAPTPTPQPIEINNNTQIIIKQPPVQIKPYDISAPFKR